MERLVLLLVCSVALSQGTILDTLRLKRETTLLSLIQSAGLDTALSGTGKTSYYRSTGKVNWS